MAKRPFRIPISSSAAQVELSETLPNQGGEATFTLTEKSGRLVGTWEGNGKSLPVEAHW
jgi:hypothetical protein